MRHGDAGGTVNIGFVRVLDDQVGGLILVARRAHRLSHDREWGRGAPYFNRGGDEILDLAMDNESRDGGL